MGANALELSYFTKISMHIILDTNIYYDNYYLNTPRFLALFTYLSKTKSKIILPDIVLKEVSKKYGEELMRFGKDFERNCRILTSGPKTLDLEKQLAAYTAFLHKQMKSRMRHVEQKEVSTKVLIERALNCVHPFVNDRGFRDTIIWLSILDLLKSHPKDYFCFISNNSNDFGREVLYEDLVSDLGVDSQRLTYFNSIEKFVSEYATKIDFINENYLKAGLLLMGKRLLDFVDYSKIKLESVDGEFATINSDVVEAIDVLNFYIYESTKDVYKVQIDFIALLDGEVTIYGTPVPNESVLKEDQASNSGNAKAQCWIEMSLLVNKKNHEVSIDRERPADVLSGQYFRDN